MKKLTWRPHLTLGQDLWRQLSYFQDTFSVFTSSVSVIYLILPLFSIFILEPSEAEALGLADEVLAVVRLREAGPGVLGLTSGPNKEKMSLGCDKSSSFFFGIIIFPL